MSRDDQPEIPLPPHGRAAAPQTVENRMPCRWCGTQTLIVTLNHYGARCLTCFEAYVREPLTPPRMPETQAVRDMRKGLRDDRPTFGGLPITDQPRARAQGGGA